MRLEQGLMIGICVLTLAYTVMNFISAKNIEVKCKGEKNTVVLVLYCVSALLLFLLERSVINIIICICLVVSGILLVSIPSGYDKTRIYTRGNKIKYKDIKDMSLKTKDKEAILTYSIDRRKYHTLITSIDDISKLNGCMQYWKRGK